MRTITLLGLLLLLGCSPIYYAPDAHNVPLISRRGEARIAALYSGNQAEFQGAYGLGERLAVKANGTLYLPGDEDNGDGGSGKYAEAGLGYYRVLGESVLFEAYGIFGFGTLENHFPSQRRPDEPRQPQLNARAVRYGLHPAIGYRRKNFDVALSSRFVGLRFGEVEGNLSFGGEDQIAYLRENRTHFLIEPALTVRGGGQLLRAQLQVGFSFNPTDPEFRQERSLLTGGLSFSLR